MRNILAVLLVIICTHAQSHEKAMPTQKESFIYNQFFATRFDLDPREAVSLPPGIQAVHVTATPRDESWLCYWRLYTDEKLLRHFPAAEGYRVDFERVSNDGFLYPPTLRRATDPPFAAEQSDLFNYRILLTSSDWYSTAVIERYKKQLIPGTAALSFSLPCELLHGATVTLFLSQHTVASDEQMRQLIKAPERAPSLGFARFPLPRLVLPGLTVR